MIYLPLLMVYHDIVRLYIAVHDALAVAEIQSLVSVSISLLFLAYFCIVNLQ